MVAWDEGAGGGKEGRYLAEGVGREWGVLEGGGERAADGPVEGREAVDVRAVAVVCGGKFENEFDGAGEEAVGGEVDRADAVCGARRGEGGGVE